MKLKKIHWKEWVAIAIGVLLIAWFLCSCTHKIYIPIETITTKTEVVRDTVIQIQHDTTRIHTTVVTPAINDVDTAIYAETDLSMAMAHISIYDNELHTDLDIWNKPTQKVTVQVKDTETTISTTNKEASEAITKLQQDKAVLLAEVERLNTFKWAALIALGVCAVVIWLLAYKLLRK